MTRSLTLLIQFKLRKSKQVVLRTLRSIEPVTEEKDRHKTCVLCSNFSTKMAYFDCEHAVQIVRCCDDCVKSITKSYLATKN